VTSRDVPARRFLPVRSGGRVEIKHLQSLIMHPDSHLWLIRVVAYCLPSPTRCCAAARARTSFRRSSLDGGGTGREKAPKIEEGTERTAPVPKRSSRHPRAPPSPAGHSVSCPCHQLGWVQMGGARPPAEEGQRRVVGDHHKVRRAAHGGEAAVSTGLDRPTRRRRATGAGCMCA
jgi:hypothetical protein